MKLTQEQVAKQFPAAYNALPECYQADHSLHFTTEEGDLFAQHTLHTKEHYVWDGVFQEWMAVTPAHSF